MYKKYVIKPRSGWIPVNLRELWEFRDLFFILSQREVKLRYKQTILGIAWVLLQPLLTAILFALIFGRVAKMPSDGDPYVLFAFAGLLPWIMFSQGLQRASNSLIQESKLISKVYFPRVLLPSACCAAVIIDFLVSLSALAVLLVYYQVPLTLNLLFLPLLLLCTLLCTIGISLWFSAFNVYYRDFMYALPFFIQLWMYASPVVYSGSMISEKWGLLYSLNPLVGIIEAFRWSLLGRDTFPFASFTISLGISFGMLFMGMIVFRRIERYFADVI
jgi:lipopolysaccharide transport system permease protein